jgi:hypothetical protein
MNEKPSLTSILGYLTLVTGLLLVVWGAWMCFNPSDDVQILVDVLNDVGIGISLAGASALGGVSLAIMGLIAMLIVIIGMGFFKGFKVAWFIAVIVYAGSFIACTYTFFESLLNGNGMASAGPLPMIVSALVVLYLLRPEVKERFGF